ncbi:MAG: hypothetical protein K2F93_04745 [Muribaculaceae bacterium]|nr:hypothetical protein [Muribaculaceae bacterium]MDE6856270.1 hypothetical protein [Muribaculaceae bacterium]
MEEPKIKYALGIQDLERLRDNGMLVGDKIVIMDTHVSDKDYALLNRFSRFEKNFFVY